MSCNELKIQISTCITSNQHYCPGEQQQKRNEKKIEHLIFVGFLVTYYKTHRFDLVACYFLNFVHFYTYHTSCGTHNLVAKQQWTTSSIPTLKRGLKTPQQTICVLQCFGVSIVLLFIRNTMFGIFWPQNGPNYVIIYRKSMNSFIYQNDKVLRTS